MNAFSQLISNVTSTPVANFSMAEYSGVQSIDQSNPKIDSPVVTIPPWRPSQRLRNLHTRFQNTILFQYICLPRAFCARLLYPTKAKWIPYDANIIYPLESNFPSTTVYTLDEGSTL
ncbi:10430_t:CDS:1, partial [Paraglomus occultum]